MSARAVTDVTPLDKLCGVPRVKGPSGIRANHQTAPDTVNIKLENKLVEKGAARFTVDSPFEYRCV